MAKRYHIDASGLKQIDAALKDLKDQIPGATASALNRTLSHAYTVAKKEVTTEYAITQAKVAKNLKKHPASKAKLHARLSSSGRTLTLGSFPHKPETTILARTLGSKHEKAQVRVKIKRAGKLAKINTNPKAFLQRAKNATNIFSRKGKSRYPIRVLNTLSVPQMVGQEKTMKAIQSQTGKKLDERITHEINYRISKAAGRMKK